MHKLFTISHQRILNFLNTTKIQKNTIGEILRSKQIAAYPNFIYQRLPKQDLKNFVKIICPVTNPIEQANVVQVSKKMRNVFSIDEEMHCLKCPMKDTCPKKGLKSQESTDAASDILLFYQAMNDIKNPQTVSYRTWTSGYKIADSVIAMMDDLSHGGKQTIQFQQLRKKHVIVMKQIEANQTIIPSIIKDNAKLSKKKVKKEQKDEQFQQFQQFQHEDEIIDNQAIDQFPLRKNNRTNFRQNSDRFQDVPRNNNINQQYNQQRPRQQREQYPQNQRYPKRNQQYQRSNNDRYNRSQTSQNFRKQFARNDNNFNNPDNTMNRWNQNGFNNRDNFTNRYNNNRFESNNKFSNRNFSNNYDNRDSFNNRNNEKNFRNNDRYANKTNNQEFSNPKIKSYTKNNQQTYKIRQQNQNIKKQKQMDIPVQKINEEVKFRKFDKGRRIDRK